MLKSKRIIYFILSLISLAFIIDCKLEHKPISVQPTIVINVNDWAVTSDDLDTIMGKIKQLYHHYSEAEKLRTAVDTCVMIGLLVTEAYSKGLDQTMELKAILDDILIAAAKEVYTRKYHIPLEEAKNAYLKRRHLRLRLGHVWVKRDDPAHVSRIAQQLRIGQSIETMAKYRSEMSQPTEREQIRFEIKSVTVGDLIEELEQVIYQLKLGQVKVVKTASGYHIFKLLDKTFRSRTQFETEQESIRQRLRRAKIEDDGGLDVERLKEQGSLKINHSMLQFIEFQMDPTAHEVEETPADSVVVATLFSTPITVGEIKSKISQLSPPMQWKFENRYTRETAVKELLRAEALNLNVRRRKKEKTLIENLLKTDTTDERTEIIKALKQLRADATALLESLRETDGIQADQDILLAIEIISTEHPQNHITLATFNNRSITVGRFRAAISKLPATTLHHLKYLEKRREFLEYVILSEFILPFEDLTTLEIREDILSKIDPQSTTYEGLIRMPHATRGNISNSVEANIPISLANIQAIESPDAGEPVGSFGTVFLTVEELEEKVSKLSEEAKAVFREKNKRAGLVENILIEKAWLKEARRLNLADQFDIQQQVKRKKEKLMIQKLLDIEVFDQGTMTHDETDKEPRQLDKQAKPNDVLMINQEERFKAYLQSLLAKAQITVNKVELTKWFSAHLPSTTEVLLDVEESNNLRYKLGSWKDFSNIMRSTDATSHHQYKR